MRTLLATLLFCSSAFANSSLTLEHPKSISLTTEPVAILFGDFHVQTEFALSDWASVVVPVMLLNPNWSPFRALTSLDPASFNGFTVPGWILGTGAGLRLYPIGKALGSGLYAEFTLFGGAGQTYALNQTIALIQQRYQIGYAWVMECGFVLDLYGGMRQSNFSTNEGQGFLLVAGLALGYAI
jgi:hypothetical protein